MNEEECVMFRNSLTASIATFALIAATPVLAKPGGGGGGGMGIGAGGGIGASVRAGGAANTDIGVNVRDTVRVQSQGSANANARAMERANENSALSNDLSSETMTGSRIRTRDLQDSSTRISSRSSTRLSQQNKAATNGLFGLQVTPGTTVTDSGGATIGTVTGIRTVGNGSVKSVEVTLNDGSVIVLSGNSLTANGDVLVTNSLTSNVNGQGAAHASINGLVHASPNSALALGGVTTLTGLTSGLTVNGSGGTAIGTVSSVLANRSGAVVGITVDLDAGGTVTIPATTLTMDGTTVVTTFTP
jgi:hypothetical protein